MPADRTEKQKSRTIETRSKTKNKDKKVKKKSQSPPAPPAPPAAPSRPTSSPIPPTVTPIAPPPLVPPPTPSHSCPVEVIEKILEHASQSTLGKCMQVSKVFYQVAAPLLYRHIIIKNEQPVSGVLSGNILIDRRPTRYNSGIVNLKSSLLSMVNQMSLKTHSCGPSSFTSNTCPNLKILHVLLETRPISVNRWCKDRHVCAILQGARPEKIVIHSDKMMELQSHHDWPIFFGRVAIKSPAVTIILNEKDVTMGIRNKVANYSRVDWRYVKGIRLIVLNKPSSLDDITGSESSLSEVQHFKLLLDTILLPLFAIAEVPVTMYLFRPFGPGSGRLERLRSTLDLRMRVLPWKGGHVDDPLIHIIGTLEHYLEQGCEDELSEEDLQYWRKESKRRGDLIKVSAGKRNRLDIKH